MEFRAAVLHELDGRLAIEDVTLRELGRDDVLVRVAASGLCHTDLEVILGSYANPVPAVLGHEGAGTVEAVGEDVTAVKPGDHVVCSWGPSCGRCFFCDRDDPILCEALARGQAAGGLLDGRTRLSLDGRPLH